MLLTAALMPVHFFAWVPVPEQAPTTPAKYEDPKAAHFTGFACNIVTTAYVLATDPQAAKRMGVESLEVTVVTTPRPNSDERYYLRKTCGFPFRCVAGVVDEHGEVHGGLDWGRLSTWRTNEEYVTKFGDRLHGVGTPGLPPSRVIPYTLVWPGFLLNILFYATITASFHLSLTTLRRLHRRRRHRCPHCGYDVKGLTTAACPECGQETNTLL